MRVTRLAPLFFLLLPSRAIAQDNVAYRVDWRGKRSDQIRRLRAGHETRVSVIGLSPFCFTYSIRVNQLTIVEQPANNIASMLLGDIPIPKELTMPKVEKPPPPPNKAADARPGVRANDAKPLKGRFDDVIVRMDKVKAALDAATASHDVALDSIKSLTKRRDGAKKALDDFVSATCVKAERGVLHGQAVAAWGEANKDLAAFADADASFNQLQKDVAATETATKLADLRLSELLTDTIPVVIEYMETRDGRLLTLQYQLLIHGLQELTSAAATGPVTILKRDRESVRAGSKTLGGFATERDAWEQPVFVRDNTERLEVVVAATGRALPNGVTPPSVTETYEAPVSRRARVATSVGVAFSAMDGRNFGRVTFPRFRGDTMVIKDSVYSTYADRGRSSKYAIAPFVQTHVSVADLENFAGYVTGGIGGRSVNGETAPEYIAGVSAGVGDRAFVTLGAHWGREERLLLGDERDVSRRPVAATVGNDSAIGTRWKAAFVMVLSWRL